MRTAKEILLSLLEEGDLFYINKKENDDICECGASTILNAMKQYAKEALEEAAEKAKSEWIRYGTYMGHSVEKQSILSLINELK